MTTDFENIPEPVLADYEAKMTAAGYLIFEYEGDWYYNEIGAGDEDSDGPYASRGEVLYLACKNLHLIDGLPTQVEFDQPLIAPRNVA